MAVKEEKEKIIEEKKKKFVDRIRGENKSRGGFLDSHQKMKFFLFFSSFHSYKPFFLFKK